MSTMKLISGSFIALAIAGILGSQVYASNQKATICHATASNTNPYVTETVDVSSFGDGHGHNGVNAGDIIPPTPNTDFPNGQNWTANGQAIYNNNCNLVTATPVPATPIPTSTPRPTSTPTPTPVATTTPSPTATPVPSATPNPTSTPSATIAPTPTPTPVVITGRGKESSMVLTDPSCNGGNMDASIVLTLNGTAVQGVNVKFIYENEAKFAKTQADGRAGVTYGYKSDSDVQIEPEDGYPAQRQKAHQIICPATSTGSVLGISTTATSGKILGMADTGSFDDIIATAAGIFGTLSTVIGSLLYAKQKNK